MATYYRGNNYKAYRSPRRSVKRIGDRTYWRLIVMMAIFVAISLFVTYKRFIG
jgi:hypothetical protein